MGVYMDRQIINEYMNMLEYDNFPEELYKYLMSPSLIRLKNVGLEVKQF